MVSDSFSSSIYATVEGTLSSFIADITGDSLPDKIPTMGVIVFTPSVSHVVSRSTGDVTYMGPEQVMTDKEGHFKVALVATDCPDLNPMNWHYLVEVSIPNKPKLRVRAQFSAGGVYKLGDVITAASPGTPINVVSTPNSGLLAALQTQVNSLATDVARLASSPSTGTVDLSGLQSQLDDLKTTVSNLPTAYDDTSLQTAIANMQKQVDSLSKTEVTPYDDSVLDSRLDYLETLDGIVTNSVNPTELDLDTGGIQTVQFTAPTTVSVKTGKRLSATVCVQGWSNVTWEGVTVHGSANVEDTYVWATLVCRDVSTNEWHLFVDAGSRMMEPTSMSRYVYESSDSIENSPESPGLYVMDAESYKDAGLSPEFSFGSWNSLTVSSRWFFQPDGVPVIVERRTPTIHEVESINPEADWQPPLIVSQVASRNFVIDNFVPIDKIGTDHYGNEIKKISNEFLPTFGELASRTLDLSDIFSVPLVKYGKDGEVYHGIESSSYSEGLVPLPTVRGEYPSQQWDNATQKMVGVAPGYSGIAYQPADDRLALWSPKQNKWINVVDTESIRPAEQLLAYLDRGVSQIHTTENDPATIEPDRAGIIRSTFTVPTTTSITTGRRLSVTLVVSGWDNVTWEGVTVHGSPSDATKDVWCSLVCRDKDTNEWHLFVDAGERLETGLSQIPAELSKSVFQGGKKNADLVGMYAVTAEDAKYFVPSVGSYNWEEASPSVSWPGGPATVIVEKRVPNADRQDSVEIVSSLVASRLYVEDNFVPVQRTIVYDSRGNPFEEHKTVPVDMLPSPGRYLAREIPVPENPASIALIPPSDGNWEHTGVEAVDTSFGVNPVPETDGTNSPRYPNMSGTAYHTELDKMVMWSPKTKTWKNLDGTAL